MKAFNRLKLFEASWARDALSRRGQRSTLIISTPLKSSLLSNQAMETWSSLLYEALGYMENVLTGPLWKKDRNHEYLSQIESWCSSGEVDDLKISKWSACAGTSSIDRALQYELFYVISYSLKLPNLFITLLLDYSWRYSDDDSFERLSSITISSYLTWRCLCKLLSFLLSFEAPGTMDII